MKTEDFLSWIKTRVPLLTKAGNTSEVKFAVMVPGSTSPVAICEAKGFRYDPINHIMWVDIIANSASWVSPAKKASKNKYPGRLTVGMRCRLKKEEVKDHIWKDYGGKDVLLVERSGAEFSVMLLGQKELKKKDPQTVINEFAWVREDALEFVNDDYATNMEFIDWYREHEEEFCGDCGAWFPDNGLEGYVCPNESCIGRLYDSGHCIYCKVKCDDNDRCPKCGETLDSMVN